MHPKSLETLEFGKALADLAGETAFSVARELALALEPALDPDHTTFPQLSALGGSIPSHGDLVRRLEGIVNDDGEIRDSASPRLRRLRADVRLANQRLQERVRTLVSEFRSALQEPIVTMRGGRYVLPVRADMQSRVRGLVHDQSASGATVYVEPLAAVELNNRLRQLEAQERDEVERILQEISGEIGAQAGSASQAVAGLADFDLQLAKARYAR